MRRVMQLGRTLPLSLAHFHYALSHAHAPPDHSWLEPNLLPHHHPSTPNPQGPALAMAEQLPHSKRRPDQEGRDHDKEQEDEDEQDDNDFQASCSDSGSDGEGEGAQSRPKRTAEQDHVDAEELDFIKRDAEATGIPLGKRRRTHQPNAESVAPPSVTSNAEATKADELWQQIKRADEPGSSSTKAASQSEEMVKVVETYKFAGQVST